ncbi:MAG: lysyl oxidase family protein [Actinomycetota bacterium]
MAATVLSVLVASVGLGTVPVAAAEPTIGMRAAKDTIEVTRRPHRPAWFDPAVYLVAHDGPFELRVTRDAYDQPIKLTRMLPGGGTEELDAGLLKGIWGLRDFFKVHVRNSQGEIVKRRSLDFCPNSWDKQRIDDSGPARESYPTYCGGGPFTKGMVWGIDQGWATSAFGYYGVKIKGPNGRYTVTTSIASKYVELLDVAADAVSAAVEVKVKTTKGGGCHHCAPPAKPLAQRMSASVPTIEDPDPSVLPDLVALPAFGMYLRSGKKKERLSFAATVWVGGASGLHVEGFRRPSEDLMDAYQYFYEDGEIVGRAPAGSFEYDDRRGHSHWHFRQFAAYRIVTADDGEVVKSTKEAFCLAPTDPVDLTLEGAEWTPDEIGFGGSTCGYETSLWIREVLPLGWGDTYMQSRPGQSFNVTNLPNGKYFIEVEANPGAFLHDQDLDNNVERRKIILKGKPGRRYVKVPPWNGIDTEGDWSGGFFF